MATIRHVSAKDGDVLLLVGTMKGAFILRSGPARERWEIGGPYFRGQPIYALAYDGRADRRRIWAGSASEHWGATLASSDDFGRNWNTPESALIRFPEDAGASLKKIWQVQPGRPDEPDVLYAGVEPAALFESRDGGTTWALNRGLWEHAHRPKWEPGFGGLCLHTIIPDPVNRGRLLVAVSAGGVYRTDDGGRSWQARNAGVRAQFLPDKYPEFGQCVHKVVRHPSQPLRLFLQNHWGLYRSDDGGDSWRDIAKGVPSDFGFAMAIHPHDADVVYILPIESDEYRCTPEGKLRVYRTRDAGGSWEALAKGLPQKDALETVLRDAMDADAMNPAGIWFGTRSGKLYGSRDGGASWSLVLEGLPPVVCVKAAVVGEPRRARVAKRTKAVRKSAARRSAPKRAAGVRANRRVPAKRRVTAGRAKRRAATERTKPRARRRTGARAR